MYMEMFLSYENEFYKIVNEEKENSNFIIYIFPTINSIYISSKLET